MASGVFDTLSNIKAEKIGMITLERAIELAEQELLKTDWIDPEYLVNSKGITNTDHAWIVPFSNPNKKKDIWVGAYKCFIILKDSGQIHLPGSGMSIERWIEKMKFGLKGKQMDLKVTVIHNKLKAVYTLKLLKPWVGEDKQFDELIIRRRLFKLPALFDNLHFEFDDYKFDVLKSQQDFEYELIEK
jgi:hypothetical protein